MKGDFTRNSFRKTRHYSSVRMQQGRVQMDADWNENEDIHRYLDRTEATDVIGGCGTPAAENGFLITFSAGKFHIGQGRYYVDGILCENEALVDFSAQPDLPGAVDPTAGTQFFYLDVWEEHVTALEDALIREVALNGPDTATRARVVWQVRAMDISAAPTKTCDAAFALIPGPTDVTMRVRAKTLDDTEACTVKPGSSYKRLENQLYRVEVHQPGNLANATFKWSRDNGTIVSGFTIAAPRTLTVDSVGRDQMLSFASGQSIEITDRRRELLALPGDFFKISRVEGNNLILDNAGPVVNAANYGAGMKVRRWDSAADIKFANLDADGYMFLEDGVQVLLAGTDFRTGDYWLIPARTVTGDVEWPKTGVTPDALSPLGIKHYYCPLAIAVPPAPWTITDCRNPFVPLNAIISLYFLGGDGQTVTPNPLDLGAFLPLEKLPTVGVSRGKVPVNGASVQFTIVSGGGQIVGSPIVTTGPDGIASCDWRLSSTVPVQQLRAELLDSSGNPTHLPITFTETLNTADRVAYTPGCPDLAGMITVQQALDELCKHRGAESCCKSIGKGGDYETIEEALKDLFKEGKDLPLGVCFCFMPGDHVWPDGLNVDGPPEGKPLSITLTGVRGASQVLGEGRVNFANLDTVAVSDLTLVFKDSITFEDVKEVDFSFCRMEMPGSFLVDVANVLTVRDCIIRTGSQTRFFGCKITDLRNNVLTLSGENDGLGIGQAQSVGIQDCIITSILSGANSTAVRLGTIQQLRMEGNTIRARHANPLVNLGVAAPVEIAGNVGNIVSAARIANPRTLTTLANTVAKTSPGDRVVMASDLGASITANFATLHPDETASLRNFQKTLLEPISDIARLKDVIGGLIVDPNNQPGGAAAPAAGQPAAGVPGVGAAINLGFSVALVLEDGDGFYHIENNVIIGIVALYGDLGPERILPDFARVLASRLKQSINDFGSGSLHFSNNDTLTIALGAAWTDKGSQQISDLMQKGTITDSVFKTGFISENSFARTPLELLFAFTTLSSNVIPGSPYSGVVIGQRASFTGNIAHSESMIVGAVTKQAEAANVDISFL